MNSIDDQIFLLYTIAAVYPGEDTTRKHKEDKRSFITFYVKQFTLFVTMA